LADIGNGRRAFAIVSRRDTPGHGQSGFFAPFAEAYSRMAFHPLVVLLDDPKKIQYKENGRPYLADGSYHISISHTKGFAAVLLHKTCEVGVDIEINSNRVNKIAGKFISEEEYIDDKHPVIHRLLHWSAKETLFKLMDKEGVDFRKDLHILPFTPCEKGILQAIVTTDQFLNRVRIHYEVSPDYVLTWTLSSRDVAV
jgi:phosphopantetheinyl transferase